MFEDFKIKIICGLKIGLCKFLKRKVKSFKLKAIIFDNVLNTFNLYEVLRSIERSKAVSIQKSCYTLSEVVIRDV